MTDGESTARDAHNREPIVVTLIINPDEDDDTRDQQARQLLAQCRDWQSVSKAQLATEPPPAHSKVMDMAAVGQIVTEVAPALISDFINQCKAWLQVSSAKPIKIKVGDREAEFPADTDPQQLEQWFLAVQASPKPDPHSN